MFLQNIHIKNLKCITDLNITFEKDITLLYGNNGVGKTTILEAISLIGHISTMRRLCLSEGSRVTDQNSFFVSKHKLLDQVSSETFDTVKAAIESTGLLTGWFDSPPPPEEAKILFQIDPGIPNVASPLVFWVYLRQRPDALSITQVLSRGASDDFEMNNLVALIYDEERKNDIDAFLQHIDSVSPYCVRSGDGETIYGRDAAPEVAKNIVAYFNMDLNDFGRKNDVRESVKDLHRHFKTEIYDRLRLPFTEPDRGGALSPRIHDRLNGILERVIQDYPGFSQSSPGSVTNVIKEAVFTIKNCSIGRDGTANLTARRRGEHADLTLDYMSAGENECFFVFLLLLGLPTDESIILFDEPDLHLTTFARETFFQELYSLIQERKIQVVIGTHSGFAFTDPAQIDRKLISRHPDPDHRRLGQWIYSDEFYPEFALQMHLYYCRSAFKVLRFIGVRKPFRYAIQMYWARIEGWGKLNPFKAGIAGAILVWLVATGVAYVSDFLEAVHLQDPQTHTFLTDYIAWIGLGAAVAVGTILSILFRRKR